MKIKTTLSVWLIVGVSLSGAAQYTVTYEANHPRPGDVLVQQEVEYMEPKGSGRNATWDFSRLVPVEKPKNILARSLGNMQLGDDISRYIQTIVNSEVTFSYLSEDSGRMIRGLENGFINSYNTGGDSLALLKQEWPSTRMEFSLPPVLLTYPFTFNDKTMSYFSGYGVYYDRLGVRLVGSVETEADAGGTAILPGKETLANVLRVKIIKTSLEEKESLYEKKNGKELKIKGDSIAAVLKLSRKDLQKTEIVRWYAEGYRYPIFETVYSYTVLDGKKTDETRRAFFYDPAQQETDYLPEDPVNRLIVERKKNQPAIRSAQSAEEALASDPESFTYGFYPNPVETDLKLELHLLEPAPVQLSLYNLQGARVYQAAKENPKGHSIESIPMTGLPAGSYLLHIVCGEETVIEKILKK